MSTTWHVEFKNDKRSSPKLLNLQKVHEQKSINVLLIGNYFEKFNSMRQ